MPLAQPQRGRGRGLPNQFGRPAQSARAGKEDRFLAVTVPRFSYARSSGVVCGTWQPRAGSAWCACVITLWKNPETDRGRRPAPRPRERDWGAGVSRLPEKRSNFAGSLLVCIKYYQSLLLSSR